MSAELCSVCQCGAIQPLIQRSERTRKSIHVALPPWFSESIPEFSYKLENFTHSPNYKVCPFMNGIGTFRKVVCETFFIELGKMKNLSFGFVIEKYCRE